MSALRLRLFGRVQLSVYDNGLERPVVITPKPLALLAYLAVAGADGAPVRRDRLLALFWPELPEPRARAALRQMLFQLRRVLGPGVLIARRDGVAISGDALCCDVVRFERALAQGDASAAVELVRGELLEAFHVDGISSEFEQWMDRERARLESTASRAAWMLAGEAEQRGNALDAVHWGRRASELAADGEAAMRHLVALLARMGDRVGALRAAATFMRRMREELDLEPSAETLALVASLREVEKERDDARRQRAATSAEPASVPASVPAAAPARAPAPASDAARIAQPTSPPSAPATRRMRWSHPIAAVATGLAIVVGILTLHTARPAAFGGGRAVVTHGASTVDPHADGLAIAGVTIALPVARGLFESGLERYYQNDQPESARLFLDALARDSSCAMCAYYAFRAQLDAQPDSARAALRTAERLSRHASERERLFIRYAAADYVNSASRLTFAESLAARYPTAPEGHVAIGAALLMAGRASEAVPHLRRAILLDSASLHGRDPLCWACDAEHHLMDAYWVLDSLAAAIRTARAWTGVQPHSRAAWAFLSDALARAGDFDDARAALDSSTRLSVEGDGVLGHAELELLAGHYDEANTLLQTIASTASPRVRREALWWRVIDLRAQGRLRDALAVARGPFRLIEIASHDSTEAHASIIAEAQVLLELGRSPDAARLFARLAQPSDSLVHAMPGVVARQRSWWLTHVGDALAAAGDTTVLAELADSVQAWGSRSGYARDQAMHQYLRGLLSLARGDSEVAVNLMQRASPVSHADYTRVNLTLARVLLALHRPRDAVRTLAYALHAPLDGGGYAVSRTELHDQLARAYEAAGERDSAVAEYREVVRAWHEADPEFRDRLAHAKAYLASVNGPSRSGRSAPR